MLRFLSKTRSARKRRIKVSRIQKAIEQAMEEAWELTRTELEQFYVDRRTDELLETKEQDKHEDNDRVRPSK
jgi:hypothetical protein